MKLYKNKVVTHNPHRALITVDILNIGYFWDNNKIMVKGIVDERHMHDLLQDPRRPIEPTETIKQLWVLP